MGTAMAVSASSIYDAHAHLGRGTGYSLTPAELIALMDGNGVEGAVICPPDRCLAYHFREGNDFLLDAARVYPGRFFPFLTASPWAPEEGLAYLEHAAAGGGVCGLKFNTTLNGCSISDPKLDPFVEFAQSHDLPIYFHTGTPIFSLPTQLMQLARRFPGAKFIMGHLGFCDYWTDGVPVAAAVPNIYVETSFYGIAPKLRQVIAELGSERVLFGSDVPICSYRLEIAKINGLQLDPATRARVFGRNLLSLLGRV
jgi:predicted TIM-barrel fold metal-dependent hydrolase